MGQMDVAEISRLLADRAESVAKMLLPGGIVRGRELEAGSVSGEAGKSLKVCLSGDKQGIWADFATGEKGDLLDLWRLSKGLSLVEAIKEAKTFLGVLDPVFTTPKARKKYRRPEKPDAKILSTFPEVMQYLTEKRKLNPEILKQYKIGGQAAVGPFPHWEKQTPFYGPWIVFPYLRGGELIGVKYLHLNRRDGKKITLVEQNCEPILFGWHAIPDEIRCITICEGELDAASLAQYGYPALSVPFGGGSGDKQQWVDHDWTHLERFETIYLCLDSDEEGEAATAELLTRLGQHRCLVVTLPKKDANQCLMEGITKEQIDLCFENAKAVAPEELRPARSFYQEVLDEFYPAGGVLPGWNMPWESIPFRFLRGEVSIVTGCNGHGKSLLWGLLMLWAMRCGEKVCIASLEMPPRKTLYRMVRQAVAKRNPHHYEVADCLDWMDGKLWLFNLVGTGKIDRLLEVFEYAMRRHGVKQFVIDSLMKLGISEDDYHGQKNLVERLCDWVNQTGAHVHLVVHPRKVDDEAPTMKMDVKGTGAITDLAFNVFAVWRNKKKEETLKDFRESGELPKGTTEQDLLDTADARLYIHKSRNVEECEGRYNLFYDGPTMRFLSRKTEAVHPLYDKEAPF